jgi:hypothetical protein
MSKAKARHPESYVREAQFFAESKNTLEECGFRTVVSRKHGATKILDATAADGAKLSFWVKLGWSGVPYAAVQFGMFPGPEGRLKSDSEFVEYVRSLCDRIRERGVTHALLVHRDTLAIAVRIDDVARIYTEQMKRFPSVARNTKSPTMWFFDPRPGGNSAASAIARRRAIPLEVLARRPGIAPTDPAATSRMAQVEVRLEQAAFRLRVGERCGWQCVVTGSTLKEALDAAHLPGKAWRVHNEADHGILVRADIHRLLDSGLAAIVRGRFRVKDAAKLEYGCYDGQPILDRQARRR